MTVSESFRFCKSIVDDLISNLTLHDASDAVAAAPPRPVIAKDVESVCKSVLNELLSEVELEGGAELADEIATEERLLREFKNGNAPSRRDLPLVLKDLCPLLNKQGFAQKLSAIDGALAMLVRFADSGIAQWTFCIAKILVRVPNVAKGLDAIDVYAPLLRMGGTNERDIVRKASRDAIRRLATQVGPPRVISKIVAEDGVGPFVLKSFMDGCPCPSMAIFDKLDDEKKIQVVASAFEEGCQSADTIFDKLDDANKLKVFLKLIEKEKEAHWCHFGHRDYCLGHLITGGTMDIPPKVREAYNLYKKKVGFKMASAFRNDVKQPHMDTLVAVASACGFTGSPNDVLTALAPHMKRERDRVKLSYEIEDRDLPPGNTPSKSEEQRRARLLERLWKAWSMLLRPEERIKKQFKKAMPESMLAPPTTALLPSGSVPAPPAVATAPPAALMPSAPPLPVMPSAPTAPAVPSAPPLCEDYLRSHVRPRTDCAGCEVARGPDATVRSLFGSECGRGSSRNISLKRACPLAAHAISAKREGGEGVALLEKYERDYGVKLTNKKQKFCDFMQKTYGVERLGKASSYKVTLYKPPRVDASLTLEGSDIKLSLKAFGYEKTSDQGTKDNYMGFQII